MDFDARKRSVMEGLASDEKDKSRKGGVDAPIAALITRINSHPLFFTTSSCSGRVSIFSEASSLRNVGSTQAQEDVTATNLCTQETNIEKNDNQKMDTDTRKKKKKKKGGDWVYVTHDAAIADELIKEVQAYCSSPQEGLLVFRFEPFILALECCTPEAAQLLVSCALSSGFRESGITSMGRRNIVGVRCSIRMEVPIAEDGELLIPEEYLRFLTALANKKMEANFQRIQKFLSNFKDQVEVSNPQIAPKVRLDCGIQEPKSPPSQSDTWQEEISAKDGFMKAASASQHHIQQPCHQRLDIKKDSTEAKERKKFLSQLKGRQMRLLARISSLEAQLGMIQEIAPGSVPSTVIFTVEGTKGNGQVVLNNGLVHRQVKEVACLANCSRRKGDELQIHRRDSVQLVPKLLQASTGSGKSDWCSSVAAPLVVQGELVGRLQRWSHSAVVMTRKSGEPSILIFGGFGAQGCHKRLGDLLMLDPLTGVLEVIISSDAPKPRMAHVAVTVGQNMVVIGGRQDPNTCLGDVCVFNLETKTWSFPQVTGAQFPPRHRHAATVVGSDIYVFGGINAGSILGDFYVLNTDFWTWTAIECEGHRPCSRHSHSLAAVAQKLYLFGGRDAKTVYGDLNVYCLETHTWVELRTGGPMSTPRFSHSMTAFGKWLVILGGCPIGKHSRDICLFDVTCSRGRLLPLALPSADFMMVRHSATLVGTSLVIIGGGAVCFAFGTTLNSSFSLDLEPYIAIGACRQSRKEEESDEAILTRIKETQGCKEQGTWILKLETKSAKTGKDALKQIGWLDRTRKPRVLCKGAYVAFPIRKEAALFLKQSNQKKASHLQDSEEPQSNLVTSTQSDRLFLQDVLVKLLATGGEIVEMEMALDLKRPISPAVTLQTAVTNLLEKAGLPMSLVEEIPKSWERLGDMAVLPAGSLSSSRWHTLGQALWTTTASVLGVTSIAQQAPVASTGTRDSRLRVLWGEGGWVEHKENGILYCFDATKCMFSSGNISEKLRMARLNCAGEVIVDLFAGIGYYVLPFLLKAGARKVYACEWNPHAITALRHNLLINGVENQCIVIEGDNRLTAPQGVADRVCLGLLPTSDGSWNTGLKALRPEGGFLHVHNNVKDVEEASWIDYLVSSLKTMSSVLGQHWTIRVVHVERVKWYAPHIRHIVVDIQCSVTTTAVGSVVGSYQR